ncbi:MAG: hypothetical protein ACLTS6_01925 [Anaerobutyricum sp.]
MKPCRGVVAMGKSITNVKVGDRVYPYPATQKMTENVRVTLGVFQSIF